MQNKFIMAVFAAVASASDIQTLYLDDLTIIQQSQLQQSGLCIDVDTPVRIALSGNRTTGYEWNASTVGGFEASKEYVMDEVVLG